MKKGLIILTTILAISCQKNNPAPAPTQTNNSSPSGCTLNDSLLKDKTWIPNDTIHTDLKFSSGGTYFQNGSIYGSWVKVGCDSLKIQHNASVFYFRLISVSADSLTLNNPLYGPLKYHN